MAKLLRASSTVGGGASQVELDLKAPIASPTFTGTVAGVTATHVGLGNVDNVADASQTSVGTIASGTWEGTTVAVAQGGTGVTSKTGTGNVVLSSSPTLVTPALGTPASGIMTNLTGTLTSPTFVTPALGTPASGVATNITGIPAANVTGVLPVGVTGGSGLDAVADSDTIPHIIPDVLYPAVAGNDLDGTDIDTSHGSTYTYGTAHADGRMYYYTDIKGSKPIKDPRIGAHFGSQRHKFKSLQLLEQETATHGKNVYSVDGREWLRAVDGTGSWQISNNTYGVSLNTGSDCTGVILEITGYFNDINFILDTGTNRCDDIDVYVNGTISVDGSTTLAGDATAGSPLGERCVDDGSVINGGSTLSASLGATPAINTLKYEAKTGSSEYIYTDGIELITQDTTSTTTKSQIQIPSQNVVSYGKKFTVADTLHYNPFAWKTDGSAWASSNYNSSAAWPTGTQAAQHNIDTATSLGLAAWVSTNYYYPYNGGRVVVWVDSSGAIKTSVNMMPPNARNISSAASNEKGDDSGGTTSAAVANTQYLPTFTDIAIDQSQAEVAKTFHWREFGNGAANQGSGGANWADASMLSETQDDIAYVMDDGLTGLSANDCRGAVGAGVDLRPEDADSDSYWYVTFIGTGVTIRTTVYAAGVYTIAQNLPYGTHILKGLRDADITPDYTLDGVALNDVAHDTYAAMNELTIHQPKMPPIPEGAVILADYMLMADTVQQATAAANYDGHISKGMLRKSLTRDFFYNPDSGSTAPALSLSLALDSGFIVQNGSGADMSIDLPHFGTKFTVHGENANTATSPDWGSAAYGGSAVGSVALIDNTGVGNAMDKFHGPTVAKDLGLNKLELTVSNGYGTRLVDMNTPIHTSSHYQTFETPFLHELVGGDRNMEQTNLVVTPDGKTWDEVTRDTSYIGKIRVVTTWQLSSDDAATFHIPTRWRGQATSNALVFYMNKDFAIGYDRAICLVSGDFLITASSYEDDAGQLVIIYVNNIEVQSQINHAAAQSGHNATIIQLLRGDYVQIKGRSYAFPEYNRFNIARI